MCDLGQREATPYHTRDIRRNGGQIPLLQDRGADMEGTRAPCLCPTPVPHQLPTLLPQQSVRHHLSLNRLFERQPRPVTDPGFGSYWTVNLEAPPGTKRPRKRGRNHRPAAEDGSEAKKRGRPRKTPAEEIDIIPPDDHPSTAMLPVPNYHMYSHQPPCSLTNVQSPSHTYSYADEVDDDGFTSPDGRSDRVPRLHRVSEYDSEEDADMDLTSQYTTPLHNHSPIPINGVGHHPRYVGPPQEPFLGNNAVDIERLKIENAGLRRQSTEALADKRRMSDALADAQSEAARARAALHKAETMLRDEEKLRREEEELRRQAEHELRELRRKWDAREEESVRMGR